MLFLLSHSLACEIIFLVKIHSSAYFSQLTVFEQALSRLPEKQTGTLRISENKTFTNDDVINYVIGALQ